MLPVGEDLVLGGRKARPVDEVDARQVVLLRHLLRAEYFFTVSGKYVPPLAVASFMTITQARPSTTPIPVTMPADACPS